MGLLMTKGAAYKPVDKVNLGSGSDEIYLHTNVKVSRMAGLLVKVMTWLLELPIVASILLYFEQSYTQGIPKADWKCLEPDMCSPDKVQAAVDCLQSPEDVPKKLQHSFHRWTILDYARAYTSGEMTPKMVADRFVAFVRESSSESLQMSFFININVEDILNQAMESTSRYKQGKPISVLDGVPIAIKDEIDCLPYPTTGGTTWLHKVRQCKNDACCVSRLRSCGAIIVGKTHMHEIGSGVSGINPHYGAARNPYDRSRVTGGYSSGSAAVVAAGLCPVALGVDGGGSIRIPAALCGVIGLKPTFARIPKEGVLPLSYTVGMVGVLAATIEDALIVYAVISGGTSSDHFSITMFEYNQPKIGLPLLKSAKYKSFDIRMAKYGKWFDDCSDDIRMCCSRAVTKLSDKHDWKIVEVTIPELEVMRLAHYLTIGSESYNQMASHLKKYWVELGWDSRVVFSIYRAFTSHEYLNAQRIRHRQLKFHQKIFSVADVIVTPTVGVTAYKIQDDTQETGEIDYINAAAFLRHQIAGNFLGLPTITVPVGYDKLGLPIGLQLIGKPWSEALLIHVASAMQELCMSECRKPEVFYDMLGKE